MVTGRAGQHPRRGNVPNGNSLTQSIAVYPAMFLFWAISALIAVAGVQVSPRQTAYTAYIGGFHPPGLQSLFSAGLSAVAVVAVPAATTSAVIVAPLAAARWVIAPWRHAQLAASNPGFFEGSQHRIRQAAWQFHRAELIEQANAANGLASQSGFICNRTD